MQGIPYFYIRGEVNEELLEMLDMKIIPMLIKQMAETLTMDSPCIKKISWKMLNSIRLVMYSLLKGEEKQMASYNGITIEGIKINLCYEKSFRFDEILVVLLKVQKQVII